MERLGWRMSPTSRRVRSNMWMCWINEESMVIYGIAGPAKEEEEYVKKGVRIAKYHQ
jgi:hypothetical protein